MVARAEAAGVPDIQPRILVLTRLIPDARGTSCDEPYERISGTEHAAIVRIPFHDSQCVSLPKPLTFLSGHNAETWHSARLPASCAAEMTSFKR